MVNTGKMIVKAKVAEYGYNGCIDYLVLVISEQYGCSVELAEWVFGVNPDRSVQSL